MSVPKPLDEPDVLALDSIGLVADMADSVAAFDAARAGAEAIEIPWKPEAIRNVAICGMGGSAIAADLVAGAFRERLRVPVGVVRDYYLPGWISEDTLVIVSSYSGETEETLTACMQALERGSPSIGITSGGKLAGRYADEGIPIVPLPPGLQPRAAILRLLVPLVVMLDRMGVVASADADLDEARETVARSVAALGPDVPSETNGAKIFAHALLDTVPIIWGAEATSPVAQRWKCQINENAKAPAYWASLPELDHNEICGFEGMGDFGPLARLVMLRDPRHHRQVGRRFELTREIVEPTVGGVLEVTADGNSPLARVVDLLMLGDYMSLYLGLLRGVDPGPVEAIGRLKSGLAATGNGQALGPA